MLAAIRHKRMRKSLERLLNSKEHKLPGQALRSALILTDKLGGELHNQLESFREKLKIEAGEFTVREFVEGIKQEDLLDYQWSKKDFSWSGDLTRKDATDIKTSTYDLVVGFYNKENLYLDKIIAGTTNSFRAGLAGGNERLFDLLVDTPEGDWMAFEGELLKYLEILKLRA